MYLAMHELIYRETVCYDMVYVQKIDVIIHHIVTFTIKKLNKYKCLISFKDNRQEVDSIFKIQHANLNVNLPKNNI